MWDGSQCGTWEIIINIIIIILALRLSNKVPRESFVEIYDLVHVEYSRGQTCCMPTTGSTEIHLSPPDDDHNVVAPTLS
jgi:hypothetical protein